MYTIYDPTTLDAAMTDAEYVTCILRDDIGVSDNLLGFLAKQPDPYYNYILFVYDDKGQILPLYVGYTNDLEHRMKTHARRVEFDEVYLYHSPTKEVALANEQRLMAMLGTCDLFNGSLTQLDHVGRAQIMEAIEAQGGPPDPVCRFAQAANYTRRTYYLTPVLVEALRIWSFTENLDLSAAARIGMVQGIPEDFVTYGIEAELVGRIPILAPILPLSEGELVRILTEADGSICAQYTAFFEALGMIFSVSDTAAELLAREAHASGSGARGLRGRLERAVTEQLFRLPRGSGIHITPEVLGEVLAHESGQSDGAERMAG